MPLRILIVDDNEDHADSLATLVELWGHVPTVAYDGEAGWRAAREARPDCLILDINMPKIDGYALARLIRSEPGLARAKLIALSAISHGPHAVRVAEVGFDYHLTKPAPLEQLEGMIKMIENIARLAEKTEELTRKNAAAAERTEELTRRNAAVVERTEELAEQNVQLAGETKELLRDVKAGLEEVKQDVQEIRGAVREIQDEVKEVKEQIEGEPPHRSDEGGHGKPST